MAHSITLPASRTTRRGVAPAIARTLKTVWAWRVRMRNRAELRRLLERADDHMLQDIGVVRSSLVAESAKQFWQE